jgi:ABC-2 type transport system permease protein
MGYVNSVVSKYDLKEMNKKLASIGVKITQPVDIRPRVWFNADLKSRNFIIPGLIAIILTIISALITSLTVAKEWERGTMEQLISTPVRSEEIIMGKFLPYFAIGFLDLLISLAVGQFVFAVPFRGDLILLFAFSALFLTGTLMLGIMVSVVTKSQLIASQVAIIITFVPAFILSGFMYPIANMPPVIQAITCVFPARYFITILKGIYLKGVGIEVLWPQGLFLFLYAGVMIVRANRNFKKKVA